MPALVGERARLRAFLRRQSCLKNELSFLRGGRQSLQTVFTNLRFACKTITFPFGKVKKGIPFFAIVFVLYYGSPKNATFYRGKSKIIMISPRIAGFPALREALGFCFFCWDDPPETGTLSDSA